MKTKLLVLQEFNTDGKPNTDCCIVEAPGIGVAIEYFLAIHGMLSYNNIRVAQLPDAFMPLDNGINDVKALIENIDDPIVAEMYNRCHIWTLIE